MTQAVTPYQGSERLGLGSTGEAPHRVCCPFQHSLEHMQDTIQGHGASVLTEGIIWLIFRTVLTLRTFLQSSFPVTGPRPAV